MQESGIMMNIFTEEEQVVLHAEELLAANGYDANIDAANYRLLLEEYKKLLKQMMKMVKMADMTELELKNISSKLEVASQTDILTGLYNRRYFNGAYQREWKNALRTNTSIALMMVDIDYFKKYNDTYGHLQGDESLAAVAREIQRVVKRPRDVAARFGGEEFVVLLPETENEGASYLAQKILEGIRKLALEHTGSPLYKMVTVSIGLAALVPNHTLTMDDFLNMTDSALYIAKKAGRNCFRLYNG